MEVKTIVWRHRRENLKKCSLSGLEKRGDIRFYTYPKDPLPDGSGYLLLKVGAPELTYADRTCGLLLIDATWRLAAIMASRGIPCLMDARSLPMGAKTAYPRRQTECPDPMQGLASIEALYLAYIILGWPAEHLLDGYYWKDLFLRTNADCINSLAPCISGNR
ncbi:MAG: hypothetical protein RL235_1091 [Chlamydiota bacterium]|jgi:pre-rRNA-processing protein TSR3